MDIILYGSGKEKIHFYYENDFGKTRDNDIHFEGVITNVARSYHDTSSELYSRTNGKIYA